MSILIVATDPFDALAKCIELDVKFSDVTWVRDVDYLDDGLVETADKDVHYTEKFKKDKPEAYQRARAKLGDRHARKDDR